MDDIRFDGLARCLGTMADRRAAARTLAGSALAAIGLSAGWQAEAKKKKKCKKPKVKCGKKCCPKGQKCIDGACAVPCTFVTAGSVMTLQANCSTASSIAIPGGVTLDGDGKTIRLVGSVSAGFDGPNLRVTGGDVGIRDVTLDGSGLTGSCGDALSYVAIRFASGQIDNATIVNLPCGAGVYAQSGSAVAITNSSIDNADIGVFADAGDVTAEGNTITNVISGLAALSTVGPPINLIATGNTIVGAQGGGGQGIFVGEDVTGEVSGNTISNFLGSESCGILIAADAGAVTIGTNTFPDPPGNEQDVCDNRP